MRYKLQEVMMIKDDKMETHWGMFYQRNKLVHSMMEQCYFLPHHSQADFLTYFNAFSLAKWKKYTQIKSLKLHLTVKGNFRVNLVGYYKNAPKTRHLFAGEILRLKEKTEIDLEFTHTDAAVVGFEVYTEFGEFRLYDGYYYTEIEEKSLNPVELAIATTTFKKEDFIVPNLKLLKERVIESGEEISEHIHIHVIDNGRTLDKAALDSERITIHPNSNCGGSGGFTRGMIEALHQKKPATHILLMDDDVIVQPESIIKTYTVLRLLKDKYKEAYISGAMLFYEQMNIQHEDVGFVHEDGSYGPLKDRAYLHDPDEVVRNELIDREEKNSYCGWWYCCIPASVIHKIGLPLPLFIRGDDVDYSLRHKDTVFITLNGICVWHMGFVAKFNAAMELYQVHRNSLIIQAMDNICTDIDFIKRITGFFNIELKRFNYDSAELLLDAIDDFMKGPEFIEKNNGEQLMKKQAAKNEKLVPLSEFKDIAVDMGEVYSDRRPVDNIFMRLLYRVTYNGHGLPMWLLKKKPAIIAYDWFYAPYKAYFRRSLLAVNPHTQTAHLRTIDNERFKVLMRRYKEVMENYERNHKAVEKAYRDKKAYMTSESFWKKYLGIDR